MNLFVSAKKMISVRIPKEMNVRLGQHVKSIGISKAALILMLLSRELNCAIREDMNESDLLAEKGKPLHKSGRDKG